MAVGVFFLSINYIVFQADDIGDTEKLRDFEKVEEAQVDKDEKNGFLETVETRDSTYNRCIPHFKNVHLERNPRGVKKVDLHKMPMSKLT